MRLSRRCLTVPDAPGTIVPIGPCDVCLNTSFDRLQETAARNPGVTSVRVTGKCRRSTSPPVGNLTRSAWPLLGSLMTACAHSAEALDGAYMLMSKETDVKVVSRREAARGT
jgi:hypothetical protein